MADSTSLLVILVLLLVFLWFGYKQGWFKNLLNPQLINIGNSNSNSNGNLNPNAPNYYSDILY
ncbi:hypothetical protein AGMMS49579_01340 [Spirochaetia bacterium]|nr:hypothetical protein AGMMS49579_01340 [Spirochaetia bacterium]